MTSSAVCKIISAEGPLSVMTSTAAQRLLGCEMHRHERRGHLPPTRGTGMQSMARRTVHAIGRDMPGVAKALAISDRSSRGSHQPAELVTHVARDHRVRRPGRVTLETCSVCCRAGRYGSRSSVARRFVTSRTVNPGMTSVVKFHPERSEAGELLHRSRRSICVTDRTDRTRAVRELKRMAAGTREVTRLAGKLDPRRIVVPPMTKQTRQPGVHCVRVSKMRIVFFLRLGGGRLGIGRAIVLTGRTLYKSICEQKDAAQQHGRLEPPRTRYLAPVLAWM